MAQNGLAPYVKGLVNPFTPYPTSSLGFLLALYLDIMVEAGPLYYYYYLFEATFPIVF
jgi:hypothetical protein